MLKNAYNEVLMSQMLEADCVTLGKRLQKP